MVHLYILCDDPRTATIPYNKAAAIAKTPAPIPATLCAAAFGVEVGLFEVDAALTPEAMAELIELAALLKTDPVVAGADVTVPDVEPVAEGMEDVPDALEVHTTAVGRPVTFAALRQKLAASVGALARSAELHFEVRQHAIVARNPPASQIPVRDV